MRKYIEGAAGETIGHQHSPADDVGAIDDDGDQLRIGGADGRHDRETALNAD